MSFDLVSRIFRFIYRREPSIDDLGDFLTVGSCNCLVCQWSYGFSIQSDTYPVVKMNVIVMTISVCLSGSEDNSIDHIMDEEQLIHNRPSIIDHRSSPRMAVVGLFGGHVGCYCLRADSNDINHEMATIYRKDS